MGVLQVRVRECIVVLVEGNLMDIAVVVVVVAAVVVVQFVLVVAGCL